MTTTTVIDEIDESSSVVFFPVNNNKNNNYNYNNHYHETNHHKHPTTNNQYNIINEVERIQQQQQLNDPLLLRDYPHTLTTNHNNKNKKEVIIIKELQEVQTQLFFLFPELQQESSFSVTTTTTTSNHNNSNNNSNSNNNTIIMTTPPPHYQQQPEQQSMNHTNRSYTPISTTTNTTNTNVATTTTTTNTTTTTPPIQGMIMSGVLWKRRDIFIHQWRPRWFIFHPELGILTYYLLLPNHNNMNNHSLTTTTTTTNNNTIITDTNSTSAAAAATTTTPSTTSVVRNRTTSYDSQQSQLLQMGLASENTIDYDVVPRGTIYLFNCTVMINDKLSSKPIITSNTTTTTTLPSSDGPNTESDIVDTDGREEGSGSHSYAFTIVTHDCIRIHLATRTEALRQQWVQQIHRVGQQQQHPSNNNNNNNNHHHVDVPQPHIHSMTTPYQQSRTISQLSFTPATVPTNFQRHQHPTTMIPPVVPTIPNGRIPSSPPTHPPPPQTTLSTSIPSMSRTSIQPRRLQLLNNNSNNNNNHETITTNTTTNTTTTHQDLVWLHRYIRPAVPFNMTLQNVTPTLQQQINDKLSHYLPMCWNNDDRSSNSNTNNNNEWKEISIPSSSSSSSKVLHHTAYQRLDTTNNNNTMKSIVLHQTKAILPHSPKHVFHLIIDITQRHKYETNIGTNNERMKYINPYTYLDYYSYKPVWPTKAREFTVVTHWEVLEHANNNNSNNHESTEQSIVILSFSCNEANNMRPNVSSQFVRANLFVSLYILQPVSVMIGTEMKIHCQFTRLLSFDLAGNIPQQFSNAITNQQANLPVIISDYLHNNPSDFVTRHHDDDGMVLSNELLVSNVINVMRESHMDDNHNENNVSSATAESSSIASVPSKKDTHTLSSRHTHPSWKVQLITFLVPIILHWIMTSFQIPCSGLVFCIVSFIVVRTIVIWHIGDAIISKQQPHPSIVSHVTCRLRIDLKGILRYISNKNEEREEMRSKRADITAIHIVASALAHGLKKEPLLLTRKVSIPWLLIRRVINVSNEPIDVSISENGNDIVTLPAVDHRTIQQIADCQKHTDNNSKIGRCLILAMSNYDEGDMTTDATPMHEDVTVVAVLGGVHLERNGNMHSQVNPKPYLNVSLTISGTHQSADLVTCRRFADEVRKLLLYPEICENMYSDTPLKLKSA